MKEACLQR